MALRTPARPDPEDGDDDEMVVPLEVFEAAGRALVTIDEDQHAGESDERKPQ